MRSISYWACRHKTPARILVILGFLLLYILGWLAGTLLKNLDLFLPGLWLFIAFVVFLCLNLIYPFRHQKERLGSRKYYFRRKTIDLALSLTVFLMIVFVGNHPELTFRDLPVLIRSASASNLPADSSLRYKTGREFAAAMRDANGKLLKWKERKKLLRVQIKAIRHSGMRTGDQVALIILCLLLAAGLAFGVAALSCSLACNDQGVLAVLVAIGGTFLIVWGSIKIIRSILKKGAPPAS